MSNLYNKQPRGYLNIAPIVLSALFFLTSFILLQGKANAQTIEDCYIDYPTSVSSFETPRQACIDEVEERCAQQHPPATSPDLYVDCLRGTNEQEQLDLTQGLTQCGVDSANRPIYVSVDVGCPDPNSKNPIIPYLNSIINFLAAGVGIVVLIMLAVGGFQYITSGGSPQRIEAAKSTITKALLALVSFIFLYAILQWLVPGGIFNPG